MLGINAMLIDKIVIKIIIILEKFIEVFSDIFFLNIGNKSIVPIDPTADNAETPAATNHANIIKLNKYIQMLGR